MMLAILCFIVVHPGPVVVLKMPSIFGCCGKRRREGRASVPLVKGVAPDGAYMELENDTSRGFQGRS